MRISLATVSLAAVCAAAVCGATVSPATLSAGRAVGSGGVPAETLPPSVEGGSTWPGSPVGTGSGTLLISMGPILLRGSLA